MGRRKLKLNERKSRLAEEITKYFNDKEIDGITDWTFGEILDQYATIGESTDTIAMRLREMTNNEIKIIHSTFANAINLTIEQGRTQFYINARIKDNIYRKPGSGRPTKQKDMRTRKSERKKIRAFIHCTSCNARYYGDLACDKNEYLNLLATPCQKCGEYEALDAMFKKVGGGKVIKGVRETEIPGINEERFLKEHEFLKTKKEAKT